MLTMKRVAELKRRGFFARTYAYESCSVSFAFTHLFFKEKLLRNGAQDTTHPVQRRL